MIEVKPHNTVTCISHVDDDGKFCAFLVKRKYPQTRMYLTNYGKSFDESILGDITFVTDFSFDSFEVLQRISTKTQLVWIDHHPIVDDAAKVNFNPEGLRSKSVSAAMLTWQYLYPNEPIPRAIQYVSQYLYSFGGKRYYTTDRISVRIYNVDASRLNRLLLRYC